MSFSWNGEDWNIFLTLFHDESMSKGFFSGGVEVIYCWQTSIFRQVRNVPHCSNQCKDLYSCYSRMVACDRYISALFKWVRYATPKFNSSPRTNDRLEDFFPFKIVHFRGYVKLGSDNSELKERPEVKPKKTETNDHDLLSFSLQPSLYVPNDIQIFSIQTPWTEPVS